MSIFLYGSQFDWQLAVSLVCVALAGIHLVRRWIKLVTGVSAETAAGCGTCGGCSGSKDGSSSTSPSSSALVSITPPKAM
jgi:hypothetical protein